MRLRYPNEIESARQARRSVFLVRQKLLNPTHKALENCTPHLRVAIDSLARLQRLLQHPDPGMVSDRPGLRKEVSELSRELRQVNALMQNACAFHAALASILSPQDDEGVGYVRRGIVPLRPSSTLQVEG